MAFIHFFFLFSLFFKFSFFFFHFLTFSDYFRIFHFYGKFSSCLLFSPYLPTFYRYFTDFILSISFFWIFRIILVLIFIVNKKYSYENDINCIRPYSVSKMNFSKEKKQNWRFLAKKQNERKWKFKRNKKSNYRDNSGTIQGVEFLVKAHWEFF